MLCLDTSALVSLFLGEQRTETVQRLVAEASDPVAISDFTEGEFAAAISTNVRMGRLTNSQGETAVESAGI